jgi:predicted nucleotidyltransferase
MKSTTYLKHWAFYKKFIMLNQLMPETKEKIEVVKEYFLERPDVSMVFVFGSYVKGREISESDFDLAIYFKPKGKRIEWQENQFFVGENQIWQDIENIVEIDTDLVVLNRVRPTVAFEILKTGLPLIIKDRKVYLEFYLTVSREAEDFREFTKDYWVTYQRGKSLSEEDKAKLIERIQFLDSEIQEFPDYRSLTLKTYKEDKFRRRNIERWIETLVISIIDVGKIVLASYQVLMKMKQESLLNLQS